MKLLTTGTAGFIGSAFVKLALEKGAQVVIVDCLEYAADLERIKAVRQACAFYKADIRDRRKIEAIFRKERPTAVVNFAAQSHVDRSIKDPGIFIETNARGVQVLLDAARRASVSRFVHISTDEVYGGIEQGAFSEDTPLNPSSPYSASKAAADLLIKAYQRTFGFPGLIVRPSNNYGPWQYPEKLIPLAVLKLLRGEKVPVYAQGTNVREWLFVEDCARGIYQVLEQGAPGRVYNLGSGEEKKNIEVIDTLLGIMHKDRSSIEFVKDRPGHDIRYRLDSDRIRNELGWQPQVAFEQGIRKTVEWCLAHQDWLLSKWKKISFLYK